MNAQLVAIQAAIAAAQARIAAMQAANQFAAMQGYTAPYGEGHFLAEAHHLDALSIEARNAS